MSSHRRRGKHPRRRPKMGAKLFDQMALVEKADIAGNLRCADAFRQHHASGDLGQTFHQAHANPPYELRPDKPLSGVVI